MALATVVDHLGALCAPSRASNFLASSPFGFIALVALVVLVASRWRGSLTVSKKQLIFCRRFERNKTPERLRDAPSSDASPVDISPAIEPLTDFDWETTKPQALRPFKPTYHITMALNNSTPSELLIIDSNYRERIAERREIMASHPSVVLGIIPEGHAPLRELYSYLLQEYMPARYPSMFSISEDKKTFRNRVTSLEFPAQAPADPIEALKILGENVEDDLILLIKTERGHLSVGFVTCYPSGFNPAEKLGRILKDIHEPVPGYEKIGPSMERFFSRLEVGKSVKRMNWSITTQPERFIPKGSHVHKGDEYVEDEEVDIEKARVRMELQTLSRLPRTGAILFNFKTYQYTLQELKDEGLGLQLADAIEGLKRATLLPCGYTRVA